MLKGVAQVGGEEGGETAEDLLWPLPRRWDKTFCLQYLPHADFDEIHFFGDETLP